MIMKKVRNFFNQFTTLPPPQPRSYSPPPHPWFELQKQQTEYLNSLETEIWKWRSLGLEEMENKLVSFGKYIKS